MADNDRESILRKIRSLMTMAERAEGNEEQAAQAMGRAMALMAKYNLDMDDVETGDPEKVQFGKYTPRYQKRWMMYCAEASAYLYHCRLSVIRDGGKHLFRWTGLPQNIEAAEITYSYLVSQVEKLYKAHLPPGLSKKLRAELRRTFKDACAMRVRQRAWRLVQAMMTDNDLALELTGRNALVVKSKAEQLAAEADELHSDMKPLTTKAPKAGVGSQMGFKAGDAVRLRETVGGKQYQIENKN